MKKLLNKLSVDGYNPFNGFNIVLSAVSGGSLGMIILTLMDGYEIKDLLGNSKDLKFILVSIVCFLLLLFRNRKLKNIPKMIIFSVISVVFGILICIIGIIIFILYVLLGDSLSGIKVPSGNSGGQSSGNKWTEQFSQTKGTYYTDGQGNFKDQNGNDVYNPQGVTDYDKL